MLSRKDFLNKFFLESSKKTRVVVSISTIGVVLFLVIASLFPFKDQLFNILYPKPVSRASAQELFRQVQKTTCANSGGTSVNCILTSTPDNGNSLIAVIGTRGTST